MKPALSDKSLRYPCSWNELPCGEAIKQGVEQTLEDISRQFFGYHLVKLGALSSEIELPQVTIRHQVNHIKSLEVASQVENTHVIGTTSSLPYQENSVDTFILSHELDYAQDPHQILREVDRCIIANGHVVVSGFNPFSFAGMATWLPFKKANLIHDARFFSCLRIKDWLQLLGFEIILERKLVFSELLFERKLDLDSPLQKWMQRNMGFLGAVYVLVGKKRELPLSIIKPRWKRVPKFTTVGASMKESTQ